MWKAILESIDKNQGPADQVGINVRFENEETKQVFTRFYKLTPNTASAMDDIRELKRTEIAKLAGFDAVVDTLETLVGKEIE